MATTREPEDIIDIDSDDEAAHARRRRRWNSARELRCRFWPANRFTSSAQLLVPERPADEAERCSHCRCRRVEIQRDRRSWPVPQRPQGAEDQDERSRKRRCPCVDPEARVSRPTRPTASTGNRFATPMAHHGPVSPTARTSRTRTGSGFQPYDTAARRAPDSGTPNQG